jgi:hypothetical protein
MDRLAPALARGWCKRGGDLILRHPGTVLIGTGFPVGKTFETDGPVGAIALYQVLQSTGHRPIMVCGPPLSRLLADGFALYELPINDRDGTMPVVDRILKETPPSLVVSIERPGVASDGRYYNMRRQDITDRVAKFDLLLEQSPCPSLAVGDGGNEIGMGSMTEHLAGLPIIPSAVSSDVLVISTVSNWGVYGIIAEMSIRLKTDLFAGLDLDGIFDFLVGGGAVDGVTCSAAISEDGFPIEVGQSIIDRLRSYVVGRIAPSAGNGAQMAAGC